MALSPTARALAECRERGWFAHVVERRLPHTNTTVDCFGFGDILALDGKPGSLLIQVTSTPNAPARVRKIETVRAYEARKWVEAGNRIIVWGFAKRGPQGRKRWTLKEYTVSL